MKIENEQNIVLLLQNKSTLAFEFIYKSYYPDLLRFANSYTMDKNLAEDIVHDTYSKLWESAESLPEITNIKSYLFTATKNNCLNYFKHLGVMDKNQDKVVEAIIFSDTYDYIDEEMEAKVQKCLEMLPVAQQMIMKMRYMENKSYSEIASELEISTETVHTHIKRAFGFFRANFNYILAIFTIS